ncbi:NHL domain-containing thioredoxin family protein [Actinotalea sp. M2MS4P-6]|uniref:NHL domain-containing thioredoxin family protein n=1 Tax=Actinotalea sp. M2MS4P-6 TaxID=2983762 RepID=UPI0021E486E6|nr:NHL domain-containing thioredoxin family protein [Actinotalea sp. M2MS4P-6]MCV2392939.1 NHL domain-containing thioredoxin family protein [Actinotalea sp. M2MS4P-6]
MTDAPARLPRVRASELVGRGWLNTGGEAISLAELRGKVVVLDFWTFCCINCLHVLDELREIEARHRDVLVVIGVHSPKFVHEADPVALAAAVERYEVHHPVLDDPELVTWSAYTARAWPTLVVVDPEGYVVAHIAGEGHGHAIEALVTELIAEHDAKGTLHRGDGPYVPPPVQPSTLRFPAKAIRLPGGNLLVADAGHHSLAELEPDAETLVRRIGSGERGLLDGPPDHARFSEPNGLCLVPDELRGRLGYDVLVADTVNHALRGVRLADGHVTTVAGTGEQFMVGGQENVAPGPDGTPWVDDRTGMTYDSDPRHVRLSSPWDVAWSAELAAFVVAMAGTHSIWAFDDEQHQIRRIAGTMNEGLVDGLGDGAWFAQTSGVAVGPDGRIWLADSETSSVRWLSPTRTPVPADAATPGDLTGAVTVHTAVGHGLFDFGHRDGPADQAMLQHPLGVAVLPDGSVAVADTYNGAIRRYDTPSDTLTTLATGLAEPSGIVVDAHEDGTLDLLVVESAAHRLTRVRLPAKLAGEILDAGAHRTARPVTEVGPDELRLEVAFTPAPGQKLDDRYGPSTRLQVSASPPGLLLEGHGDGTDLVRTLRLDPAVGEGVLHVTAQAASCDDDPAIEFPACHLAQQDWGVPVRVVDGAERTLRLPLLG